MITHQCKKIAASTCPHDCPSTCSLMIDFDQEGKVHRVRGAKENSYTAGVICAKVARYAERIYHPERLTHCYRRKGGRGEGNFQKISYNNALDEVAEAFLKAGARFGHESVWPYYFAGTMGLVQRDCINRLRKLMHYSNQHSTICTTPGWAGYIAGTGRLGGVDPREMTEADCIIIWGTNPVSTQVNVMTHAIRARKQRGTKIVVVDIYETGTMKQADLKIILRPGTDGALAVAIMHVLFREDYADHDFLENFTDDPNGLARHVLNKTPQWAESITGVKAETIETLATLIGTTKKTFFRIGYGLSRQHNGAINMHAVSAIPAITGSWHHQGGGAFFSNSGSYPLHNNAMMGVGEGRADTRSLDQSRIGAVLCGEQADLHGGPPVTGLFIQNTNPILVAPDLEKVRKGFMREDLFVCVHEQFMTETAELADIVIPATMFTEHDDIYRGGGHTYMSLGLKVMEPPRGCRSNYEVVSDLAKRLGLEDEDFRLTARDHVDRIIRTSGLGGLKACEKEPFQDLITDPQRAHFKTGFDWPDGKFRFRPVWDDVARLIAFPSTMGKLGPYEELPEWPDYWAENETVDASHPFRLATAPARQFLNSSFTETPTSKTQEGRPSLLIHPEDAACLSIHDEDRVIIGNELGTVTLHAKLFDGLIRGVVIAESIWPHKAHIGGKAINTLISARPIAPFGGAAFHDCRVWLKPAM